MVRFPSRKTFPAIVNVFVELFQLIWPTLAPLCETHV
jgi:hypothetical protein